MACIWIGLFMNVTIFIHTCTAFNGVLDLTEAACHQKPLKNTQRNKCDIILFKTCLMLTDVCRTENDDNAFILFAGSPKFQAFILRVF